MKSAWMLPVVVLLAASTGGCSQDSIPGNQVKSEPSRFAEESQTPAESAKPAKLQAGQTAQPIRIATYNINFTNVRLDAVVETIRQADADLVCLQETNEESAAALHREFAQDYGTIRFYGSVRPYAAGGFGLLSRVPVQREESRPAGEPRTTGTLSA